MTTSVTTVPVRFATHTVTVAASPVYINMQGHSVPATVTAAPAGGGSLAIAYSTTPTAASNPGAAVWVNWTAGTVSSATSQTLISPVVAIRATATNATCVVEIAS
jgi:hypothetical protein